MSQKVFLGEMARPGTVLGGFEMICKHDWVVDQVHDEEHITILCKKCQRRASGDIDKKKKVKVGDPYTRRQVI